MKNIGNKTENGWIYVEYRTTWEADYDFILDAAQIVINTDFRENLQLIAASKAEGIEYKNVMQELAGCKYQLRNCPETYERNGSILIAGESQLMMCPIQLVFYTDTSMVRLCSPDVDYFKKNGMDVFDNYINSVEIKAHCLKTERELKERYNIV